MVQEEQEDEPNCAPSTPTRSASYRELIALALGDESADFSSVTTRLEETDCGDDIMKAYGREMFNETEGHAKPTTKTGVGDNKTSRWFREQWTRTDARINVVQNFTKELDASVAKANQITRLLLLRTFFKGPRAPSREARGGRPRTIPRHRARDPRMLRATNTPVPAPDPESHHHSLPPPPPHTHTHTPHAHCVNTATTATTKKQLVSRHTLRSIVESPRHANAFGVV